MSDALGARPTEARVRDRLVALGWLESEWRPLLYLLRWRGPGRVLAATPDHVDLEDRDGARLRWVRGRCLTRPD